jgi:hypothetical protein
MERDGEKIKKFHFFIFSPSLSEGYSGENLQFSPKGLSTQPQALFAFKQPHIFVKHSNQKSSLINFINRQPCTRLGGVQYISNWAADGFRFGVVFSLLFFVPLEVSYFLFHKIEDSKN